MGHYLLCAQVEVGYAGPGYLRFGVEDLLRAHPALASTSITFRSAGDGPGPGPAGPGPAGPAVH